MNEDINELKEQIKVLRKLLNEKRDIIKIKSSDVVYYNDLYKRELEQNNILKKRIENKNKEIEKLDTAMRRGYKQSDSFDKECSGIYRIYNKTTGKSYIGQSSVNVYKRCMGHFAPADYPETDWHYDLIENPEYYDYEILVEGVANQGDLDRLEIYYIGKYNSIENGYNKTCRARFNFIRKYTTLYNE